MKFLAVLFLVLQMGSFANAEFAQGIQFDNDSCVAQLTKLGSREAIRLCRIHEEQFPSAKMLKSAIYAFNYTMCNVRSGDLSRYAGVNSVPCVNYLVETDFQKAYVLTNLFGVKRPTPLNYKGLYLHIAVVPRQLQMQ